MVTRMILMTILILAILFATWVKDREAMNPPFKRRFVIDLTVDYDKNGNGGSVPGHFVFNATARKTFLPGMSYSFEFTLKFFGDFKETELTLGILEFTEIKNVTDPVGGE